jgi:hypothetical protein
MNSELMAAREQITALRAEVERLERERNEARERIVELHEIVPTYFEMEQDRDHYKAKVERLERENGVLKSCVVYDEHGPGEIEISDLIEDRDRYKAVADAVREEPHILKALADGQWMIMESGSAATAKVWAQNILSQLDKDEKAIWHVAHPPIDKPDERKAICGSAEKAWPVWERWQDNKTMCPDCKKLHVAALMELQKEHEDTYSPHGIDKDEKAKDGE